MSRILSIAWKDTLLRFASPSELLFFIVLPVIFSLIVSGFATGQGNGDNRIVVLVVEQDGGALSSDLVQTLASRRKACGPRCWTQMQPPSVRRRRRAGPAHHPGRLRGQPAGRPAGGPGACSSNRPTPTAWPRSRPSRPPRPRSARPCRRPAAA